MSVAHFWQNPILLRTQRQGARLRRAPWIILAALVLVTLLVAAVGGIAAEAGDPAMVGTILFNVFFVIAAGLVSVMGAGLAGHGLASEHQGRTWEALLLTSMTPREVLTGKFLSALANVLLYLAALAPVAAVAFLFGGVSALECGFAFVFLIALAALAVSMGLAAASTTPQYGAVVSVLSTILVFTCFAVPVIGFGGANLVSALWPTLHLETPVWWPAVVVRAPFDAQYVLYAWVIPVAAFALPTWLGFELAVAQVLESGQDRFFGWKRAFFLTTLITAAIAMACIALSPDEERAQLTTVLGIGLHLWLIGGVVILAGDDVYPFRRARQELQGHGALRRLLGPSVLRSTALYLVVWMLTLLATTAVAVIRLRPFHPLSGSHILEMLLFDMTLISFVLLSAGFIVLLRTTRYTPLTARILLGVAQLAITAAPWVLYAIAGGISSGGGDALKVLACLSPFYVIAMFDAVSPYGATDTTVIVGAGVFVAILYVALALSFFALAARRTSKALGAELAYQREVDQQLAAEDAETP